MPGTLSSEPAWKEGTGYAGAPDGGDTVEWVLQDDGSWSRTPGDVKEAEAHIDSLSGETGIWRHRRSARWPKKVARQHVEIAIAKGKTGEWSRYRLVGAAPVEMDPETKERLRQASEARRLQKMQDKLAVQGSTDLKNEQGEDEMEETAKKAKSKKPKKEKKEKKSYMTVNYAPVAAKAETEKAKGLLAKENTSQGAEVYRFITRKTTALFSEILEHMKEHLKGKPAKTVESNTRYYVNDLRKKGLLRSFTEAVEAASHEEALGN